MEYEWKWDKLDPTERRVAELLVQGKSNATICGEVCLSRARVQDCIKRILIKTGADTTRAVIVQLVEERENLALIGLLDEATDGVMIVQDRVVAFANRTVHRICEYEPYEMHGIPMIELIAPRARDSIMKKYELRMKGEPFTQSYAVPILCKDGREKEVTAASIGLIRYRGKPAAAGIVVPHS